MRRHRTGSNWLWRRPLKSLKTTMGPTAPLWLHGVLNSRPPSAVLSFFPPFFRSFALQHVIDLPPPHLRVPARLPSRYQQACTAVLCAMLSGSSNTTLVQLVQRAGHLCIKVFDTHYGGSDEKKANVKKLMNPDYVSAAGDIAWGGQGSDPVWQKFFK